LKGFRLKSNTTQHNKKGVWQEFAKQEGLLSNQLELFQRYFTLLLEWNEKVNLTAITELKSVIAYHFQDSLRLGQCVCISVCVSLSL